MEILNQIEQLKERIAEVDRDIVYLSGLLEGKELLLGEGLSEEFMEETKRDIVIYTNMIDSKKMTNIALEEMVDKLSKQVDDEYGK